MSPDKLQPLLIVEDDLALQKQIKWSLDRFESVTADDRESAMTQLRRHAPAVVTMDLGLPPDADSVSEGFKLLEQILGVDPDTKVIVLTGQNDQSNALKAVAMGAYDFLAKPFEPEVLNLTVERAFRLHHLQAENKRLQAMQMPDTLAGLLTRDPQMLRICRTIEKVANTNASVMLLGESGTGKEVLARGLHQLSNRKDGKFVAINCAAIPENLLESELFGYEKGAFTGAAKTTPGKIETAHAGTLMLDEIGDMPMSLQAKLLRFLQERVVERVGGRQEIAVDVRVVCATHQNLTQCVKEGRFREDLYYRLAEIVVEIPPLRARVGDAALLAHAFVRRFGQEHRRNLTLADDALRAIEAHPWPGNIRELENCIKRATIMADGNQITADDVGLAGAASAEGDRSLDLRVTREAAEQRAVLAALARADGTIAKAADLLGVSRPTLYDLMHRLGLKP
ncbi:PEP-CTERM-box response regulator transcription factor [Acidovorax carolinensis]|uniref:PEP-CTERM-box response regulator transcription factor n=2 Tax=Acidovorax carolinensis TaxID=553814 RepID=A0A240UFS1_9BURK|nr:PEP-CTERM-box response regulator transcription factor [Acidovorax carolinensis]ART49623.1 PEP-CTERM-box response regulator transcription factor [Acidovorax carolinensis]ART53127.1 PEP-CTERM-box response regulator transcription factor [Acidovorax carolinensis]ART60347.1 PEP-CTERM-box response regulator transcription factor [Acidovorax carolinensis]